MGTKRSVNIRNILYTTASTTAGNYKNNYAVVQTAGRTLNNRYFVKNEGIALPTTPINLKGTLPGTTTLSTLLGLKFGVKSFGNFFGAKWNTADEVFDTSNRYEVLANFATIIRTGSKTESIFVNRFSAPGGPEVNTLSYLDIAAAEKSVYNALPYRNLSVLSSGSGEEGTIRVRDQLGKRRGLRTLTALHAGPFGSDATFGSVPSDTYITSPSFYKINRNPRRRIRFSGVTGYGDDNFITGTVYDNASVTHPIPRSTYQYAWITASAEPTRKIYGYAPLDGMLSNSAGGVQNAIDFIQQSAIKGSFTAGGGGVNVDFAGTNILIYDPLNTATNLLSSSTGDYRNADVKAKMSTPISLPEMLNGLNLHRNGPYQWPTWKQIRTGESPTGRSLRKRNILSYFRKMVYDFPLNPSTNPRVPLRGPVSSFTEAPVTNRFRPRRPALEHSRSHPGWGGGNQTRSV